MNKWKLWAFWHWVRDYAQKKMRDAWMIGGNCDSACPRCKQWESHGNQISTKSLEDGSEQRECSACGYQWRAIFTPAGFVPVESAATGENDG